MDLAAPHEFQRLYGEVVAIWKTWNALKGDYPAAFSPPEDAKWNCLKRATSAEGAMMSLLAQIAAGRILSAEDVAIPGGIRQAFKSVRRTIREDAPFSWWADNVDEYAAF